MCALVLKHVLLKEMTAHNNKNNLDLYRAFRDTQKQQDTTNSTILVF